MRNAIIISLLFHVSVYFASTRIVRFRSVRYIPRQVYMVRLFSMEEAKPLTKREDVKTPQVPAREKSKPVEELTAPVPKPKAVKKKKRKEKTVPSAEVKKEPTSSKDNEGATEDAASKPSTGDMSLDAEDFPFGYYLITVRRKIASNWNVPLSGSNEELYCKVYFRISRSGSIADPGIEASSGSFLFDQAALRAVIQASPLPPLPGEYQDRYLGVHFSFAYENK